MAVVDVDMYLEDQDYHVVFHHIETKEQRKRIKEWVNTLRGISTGFSEYLFINDAEDDGPGETEMNLTGTISIIPEGKYKGLTIEDAYNMNGHYSLSELLLTIKKMTSVSAEEAKAIYKEAVEYTIPLLKEIDIEFEDFLAAYKPFLKRYVPGEGKALMDWLKMTKAEQQVAYEEMVDKIIERMYKSIAV